MQRGFAAALGNWRTKEGPLARSLATAVREAVVDGRIPAGTRLPSERELARALELSRGTVVTALTRLRDDGWLHTRHGSGSVVRLPARLTERTTPWSLDRGGAGDADLDLTLAVTAAPHEAYLAALGRAVERSAALLVDSGVATAGLPRLRELLAERYTRSGLATRPEQILVTSGAQAALTLLVDRLHTDRRSPVVVESPTYPGALAILRRRRARLLPVPVTAAHGWDTERLAETVRANGPQLAYLIPDFHNPTGAHMTAPTRTAVAALAERHALTVVVDETMRDLDLRTPPGTEPHLSGARVIQIGSASKVLWSGLRIGWIRASADLVREVLRNPLQAQLSPPPLEQLIAAELLGEGDGGGDGLDAVLADRRARLRRQRDHLAGLLAGTGWTYTVPDGGLSLWLHLGEPTTATELAARAAGRGLAVSPGPLFAVDRASLAHHLRLPFTATRDVLTRAVALLTG
ncbi:PLP-dependent aminotransferase family protein [Streptomyces sp. NBC_00620]|uniref:aminotransferase-like domain-containing protein n=1 Tax=Streptomyces sp. NBC_00620 TaxID=2903666 RepID=UPI00225B4375|nr:PLP-dependent aminotransferase family protein [Streptomyces sp. NBC_00620]MCX4977635.1 PLP-dependent aminotransferase family protein [Streptomyces sp. NBC_00620]